MREGNLYKKSRRKAPAVRRIWKNKTNKKSKKTGRKIGWQQRKTEKLKTEKNGEKKEEEKKE